MKTFRAISIFVVLVFVSLPGFTYAEDEPWQPNPAGMFCPTPVEARSCVAVRVPIDMDQALQGVRWYHNDVATVFPKVLVASGRKDLPPLYADGIVAKENVGGVEAGWSIVEFNQPLASDSGSLFVIFQLPENQEGVDLGEGPGFGFVSSETGSSVYLSPDGDDWTRLNSTSRLLMAPVYTTRDPGMMALKSFSGAEPEDSEDIPAQIERTELFASYPNPFNPKTTIAFNLKNPGPIELLVFDVRGRLVDELEYGRLEAGRHEYMWLGTDRAGKRAASGVYFARLKADGQSFVGRMLLVK